MTMFYRPPAVPIVPRDRITPKPRRTRRYNRPEFKVRKDLMHILRFILEEMHRQKMHRRIMAERIGIHEDTIGDWSRRKVNPTIANCEAALNVLGYTLAPVPLDGPKQCSCSHEQIAQADNNGVCIIGGCPYGGDL